MDLALRDRFLEAWGRHFGGAELPITFEYTDAPGRAEAHRPAGDHECVLAPLARVRHGQALQLDAGGVGCGGGRRYLGFSQALHPEFEAFLSCGIPGKLEGERYKQSPALVREYLRQTPTFTAPARYLLCKRWDALGAEDAPQAAIFVARPDVLAGLFTLANFDEAGLQAVIAPFAAGCGAMVQYPLLEGRSDRPRAVLGGFDVSARPYLPAGALTFAVPIRKLERMVANLAESFLITPAWAAVRGRMP